jgi:hypothetical protein
MHTRSLKKGDTCLLKKGGTCLLRKLEENAPRSFLASRYRPLCVVAFLQ